MTSQGLRSIEQRAWLRTFEHGLWDLGLGMLLASFGVSILTGYTWVSPLWIPIAIPLIQVLGSRIVVPRIGRATFRGRRRQSRGRIMLLLSGLVVLGLGMFLITGWSGRADAPTWVDWIRQHFVVVLGAIWGGALSIGAWAVSVPRFYGYGLLLLATTVASAATPGFHLGHALTLCGSLILVAGILLFIRFLQRYPPHAPEVEDV